MEELDSFWLEYVRVFNAGDAETLADMYTEDVDVILGGIPFRIEGRAAVRAVLEELFSGGHGLTLHLYSKKYHLLGAAAAYSGYYRATVTDEAGGRTVENGRFLGTLAKVGGKWQIAANHGAAFP